MEGAAGDPEPSSSSSCCILSQPAPRPDSHGEGRQDSTAATSGEGGSPELPARSASLSTGGIQQTPGQSRGQHEHHRSDEPRTVRTDEGADAWGADAGAAQPALPPPLHPPQQQQPPTIHDNQLHGTVVCSVGSWALYLDSEM